MMTILIFSLASILISPNLLYSLSLLVIRLDAEEYKSTLTWPYGEGQYPVSYSTWLVFLLNNSSDLIVTFWSWTVSYYCQPLCILIRYDYKLAVFNHSISLFGYLPETKAKVVEAFEGGGDDVVALSGLRNKARTLLEETDKRYLGKATS